MRWLQALPLPPLLARANFPLSLPFSSACHAAYENCEIQLCTYYLKDAEIKTTMSAHFREYHGNNKKILRVYMVLWDTVSQLETFLWNWNHISRFIT